jgi:hypothetical protein
MFSMFLILLIIIYLEFINRLQDYKSKEVSHISVKTNIGLKMVTQILPYGVFMIHPTTECLGFTPSGNVGEIPVSTGYDIT